MVLSDEIYNKLKQVAEELAKIYEERWLEGWSFTAIVNNAKALLDMVLTIVSVVEYVSREITPLSSEGKLELAADLLDAAIKFKGVYAPLELIDNKIFKLIISLTVEFLNKHVGTAWLDTLSMRTSSIAKILHKIESYLS